MFTPEAFNTVDGKISYLAKLISAFPFATLVSTADGELQISKVPIIFENSKIYGHLSTRNEHCKYLINLKAKHRLLIDGPHGFISPKFLGNRAHDIPTWNYVSAVINAPVIPIQSANDIIQLLSRQLKIYDDQDVSYLESSEFSIIEQEIMGFSMDFSEKDFLIKRKFSQNKSDSDFSEIIKSLKISNQSNLADWMLETRS